MIVRGHQDVDGVDHPQHGVITVFSCPDYMGNGNHAAIIVFDGTRIAAVEIEGCAGMSVTPGRCVGAGPKDGTGGEVDGRDSPGRSALRACPLYVAIPAQQTDLGRMGRLCRSARVGMPEAALGGSLPGARCKSKSKSLTRCVGPRPGTTRKGVV
jgi:hypothetical protein